mgnify:FL=1|tara:strand:+ start:98 stop:547 length:450 start_codon:yes stop_codon:yes gene_type:complete
MEVNITNTYNWIKVVHIWFMVAWMASLAYLPRLFIYHIENIDKPEITNTFKIMERRLYNLIANPSLVLVWITGLYLANVLGFYIWIIIKIFFVFLITLWHIRLGFHLKDFKNNSNRKSSKYFRIMNEFPFIIMLIILFLVIFKPFIGVW